MNPKTNEQAVKLHGVTEAQAELLDAQSEVVSVSDATPDDIEGLRHRGEAVAKAAQKMMSKYFDLTDWIREKQLSDGIVRRELLPYLPKTRISEVLRVAQVSPKLYGEFKERAMGFKLALAAARAEDGEGDGEDEGEDKYTAREFKEAIYGFIVRQAAKTDSPVSMPKFIKSGKFVKDGLAIEWKVKRIETSNTSSK